jgi:iron complex transport system substrate-binding protein
MKGHATTAKNATDTRRADEERIAEAILDAAFLVHRHFGPGLLESVYEAAVAEELTRRGFEVTRQRPVSVVYRGRDLGLGFRADLVVNGLVLVELKSVSKMEPVFGKQVLTYLKLGGWRLGLLMNFNTPMLRDGIQRVVNGLPESSSRSLRSSRDPSSPLTQETP